MTEAQIIEHVLANRGQIAAWFEDAEIDFSELVHGHKHGRLSDEELGGEVLGLLAEKDYTLMDNTTEDTLWQTDHAKLGRALREAK